MKIVTKQFIHTGTYHYYFKKNAEECRSGKTKKKDIYYVTVY